MFGQINFGPKNAMFEIPEESVQHLKPLYIYIKVLLERKPVTRMMADGRDVVNLM
jgi:hypothetical protein